MKTEEHVPRECLYCLLQVRLQGITIRQRAESNPWVMSDCPDMKPLSHVSPKVITINSLPPLPPSKMLYLT